MDDVGRNYWNSAIKAALALLDAQSVDRPYYSASDVVQRDAELRAKLRDLFEWG